MATNFIFLESNWPTLLDDAQQVKLNVMGSCCSNKMKEDQSTMVCWD